MARQKNDRLLNFKPKIGHFGPLDSQSLDFIHLEHEEMEALYLMDYLEQYQEVCAEKMGISRPTFSRIVRTARKKVADALIHGKTIQVNDEKTEFIVALPSSDQESIDQHVILARYFGFFHVAPDAQTLIEWIENPIWQECQAQGLQFSNDDEAKGMAAGRVIPPLLERAHIVLVRSIGDGLRRNIEGSGKVLRITDRYGITDAIEQFKNTSTQKETS